MIDIVRSIWIWVATASLVIGWVPLLCLIRLTDRDPLRLRTARWFRQLGRLISRVNPWRLHIAGVSHIEPNRPYVIVSNHQSLADIPLLTHIRIDAKWLAKVELFQLPVVGWMLKMAGDIPVFRNNRRKAAHSLLQAARCLKQGCSLIFFPEGTRSPDGSVLPFNDGPFQIAIREKVQVLPLAVEGSGAALPRSSWIFSGTQDIHLRVLAPVPVTEWTVKQSGELRERVRQMIIDEVARMRSQHN